MVDCSPGGSDVDVGSGAAPEGGAAVAPIAEEVPELSTVGDNDHDLPTGSGLGVGALAAAPPGPVDLLLKNLSSN